MKKLILLAFLMMPFSLVAQDNAKSGANPDRAKMAEMHEKVATCLKSDKPLSECRAEMKDMGEGCGMMMRQKGPKR